MHHFYFDASALVKRYTQEGDELVLVASDQRLLRAAQTEEILVFNPEIDSQEALEVWVFDTSGRDDDC